MSIPPTGSQYEIAAHGQRAVVTEVGATLRRYQVDGRDVIRGFAAGETVTGCRGQNLLPWPNRIRDGRYAFAGRVEQLPLSEPHRQNASHGLASYLPWRLVGHEADRVVLRTRVHPQPGWSGLLEATLSYTLEASGLSVAVHAANLGDQAFPFGYGAHPYLTAGETAVDELELTLPGGAYLAVDDRLLPTGTAAVAGTDLDLRTGRVLGEQRLDVAITDLERGADGRWRASVRRGARTAEIWGDAAIGWVQVFTGDPYRTWGLAVEPMTCGPDAFNGGPGANGLVTLKPEETFSCHWGLSGS